MPTNMTMPRLSDTMEVGTIVKWHVKPGDKVKSGQVIADIETDKATMELQTFDDGTIGELSIAAGKSCPVGQTILKWQGGDDAPAASSAPATAAGAGTSTASAAGAGAARSTPSTSASAVAVAPAPTTHPAHSTDRVFASPLARKIAADSNIDLARIEGSGPSGRIVRKDVEAFLSTAGSNTGTATSARRADTLSILARHGGSTHDDRPAHPAPIFKPKPLPDSPIKTAAEAATALPPIAALMNPSLGALERTSIPLSNMRRTIAARLVESKTTIPHYQVTISARMDALLALRTQLNEQLSTQGVKLSVNDFIVRASALSMHAHPFINARWNPAKGAETIELLDQVNVGVAISLGQDKGGGLVVATIRNADQKGLRLISAETKSYAEKARTRGLSIDDMSDSTFTISNLGMFGVDHFTAIINPPNAAILAVGAAIEQPVVDTDPTGKKTLGIGTVMSMTMSSDHRLIDGSMAAQFLQTIKHMLEKPATLLV